MDDECDFIFDRLGICSCGSTGQQVDFIAKYLKVLNDSDDRLLDAVNVVKDMPEAVVEILNHFLTKTNVTEYGSSCRYSWVCRDEETQEFYKRLQEFANE